MSILRKRWPHSRCAPLEAALCLGQVTSSPTTLGRQRGLAHEGTGTGRQNKTHVTETHKSSHSPAHGRAKNKAACTLGPTWPPAHLEVRQGDGLRPGSISALAQAQLVWCCRARTWAMSQASLQMTLQAQRVSARCRLLKDGVTSKTEGSMALGAWNSG